MRTTVIQGVLRSCQPSSRSSPGAGVCSAAATAAPQDWLGVCRIGTAKLPEVWALRAFLHAPHVKRRGTRGRGGEEVPAHRCVCTHVVVHVETHAQYPHFASVPYSMCTTPPHTHTHTHKHTLVCADGAEDRVAKSLAYVGEQRIVDRSVADRGESARVRECVQTQSRERERERERETARVCAQERTREGERERERERKEQLSGKGSGKGLEGGRQAGDLKTGDTEEQAMKTGDTEVDSYGISRTRHRVWTRVFGHVHGGVSTRLISC